MLLTTDHEKNSPFILEGNTARVSPFILEGNTFGSLFHEFLAIALVLVQGNNFLISAIHGSVSSELQAYIFHNST
jgi:hypothetical protein